jgi:hypothetical protein
VARKLTDTEFKRLWAEAGGRSAERARRARAAVPAPGSWREHMHAVVDAFLADGGDAWAFPTVPGARYTVRRSDGALVLVRD